MSAVTNTAIQADVAAIIELLGHQRSLYRRLRLLADRQRALVVAEDHQPLMDLLTERQKLVDGLVGLTSKMAPYRERWTQLYQDMNETSRRTVTALLEEVNSALAAILKSDSSDTATLMAQRDHTAREMKTISNGRYVGAAYAAAGTSDRRVLADSEA